MLSILQLERHHLAEVTLKPTEGLAEELRKKKYLACQQRVALRHAEGDTLRWMLRLVVELMQGKDDQRSVYTGRIEIIGEFLLQADVPEAEREKIVRVNGSAMLFGAAREWIALLTSRSIHGAVELPTIDPRSFLPPESKQADSKRTKT